MRQWVCEGMGRVAVAVCLLFAVGCDNAAPDTGGGCDQGTLCRDSDCDTICDADEGYPDVDTDGDGVPDYMDLDADGDGVRDAQEAGDADLATPPFDTDGDGTPDFQQADDPFRGPEGEPDSAVPVPDGGQLPADSSTPNWDADVVDSALPDTPDAGPAPGGESTCDAPVDPGCIENEVGSCDGVDNDCDGDVDEGAFCVCGARGEVRACFRGSPGQRGVGTCTDGTQICGGEGEFATWGPCTGGVVPGAERCDDVDNDCNGCVDDLRACKPVLSCPEPGDPRVPAARPFEAYTLDARDFYSGDDALAYRWRIAGSPCDTLFQALDASATATSGKLSHRLRGENAQIANFDFSLSGDYPLELAVETENGPLSCNFDVPVRAPGLRVELCWDQTGPVAYARQTRVDLDLHLAKQGTTTAWGEDSDCFWGTCKGHTSPFLYPRSSLDHCRGSQNTAVYENPLVNGCPNPRLDADNRLDAASAQAYVTENINLDAPQGGDHYRVMVEYNTNTPTDRGDATALATHPLVNIYCGGQRLATFGGSPTATGPDDPEEVQGFDHPGQRWHVADVAVLSGGEATLCDLVALDSEGGYWIAEDGGTPQ